MGQLIAVIVITDNFVRLLSAGVQRKNAILAQFCICGIRKADRRWLQQNERKLSDIIASDEISHTTRLVLDANRNSHRDDGGVTDGRTFDREPHRLGETRAHL